MRTVASIFAVLTSGCSALSLADTTSSPVLLNGVDLHQPISGRYNEPFWTIRLDGRSITFSGADLPEVRAPQPRPLMADGRAVYGTATTDGQPLTVVLEARDDCSDSMSDFSYPLGVTILIDGRSFEGCAAGAEALDDARSDGD